MMKDHEADIEPHEDMLAIPLNRKPRYHRRQSVVYHLRG
jgi:hypothetical protein